ncbi:MAG: hypothetical protein ACLFUC_02155 [Bacteroidales bacterium]
MKRSAYYHVCARKLKCWIKKPIFKACEAPKVQFTDIIEQFWSEHNEEMDIMDRLLSSF